MTIIAIALLVLLSLLTLFVLSTIVGTRGTTRAHHIAFYAGVIGLAAILACFIVSSRVASQIPYITSGAVFFICIAILLCASCMCVLALLTIRQGRSRAA